MARTRLLLCILAVLSLSFVACGSSNDEANVGLGGESQVSGVSLDPAFSVADRERVTGDLAQVAAAQIDGSRVRFFESAFGGPGSEHVFAYLDQRLNYLLPPGTRIGPRILLDGQPLDFDIPEPPEPPGVNAGNIGTALWIAQESLRPSTLQLRIGDAAVSLESSRVGIIALGQGYSANPSELVRSSVLIHESRHSDCTGGLPRSDVERFADGELPLQTECGHFHVECPAGHPMAGLPACDDERWGAYAIQVLYATAVGGTCASCPPEELDAARAIAVDSSLRVLNFDALVDGALGEPDMSSQGVVD